MSIETSIIESERCEVFDEPSTPMSRIFVTIELLVSSEDEIY